MFRTVALLSVTFGFILLVTSGPARSIASASASAQASAHAYFDNLVSRVDHWKSYSLRSKAQLDHPRDGGFAHSNDKFIGRWVTYAPESDPDPNRQDAAKVVIPAFAHLRADNALAEPTSATATTLTLMYTGPNFVKDRSIQIDTEIATIVSVSGNTLQVARGAHGTTAAPHAAGAAVKISANSLLNQVRLPLGTADGHTYFMTWDAYWTDSYLGTNTHSHKTFQFSSGGDGIWMEPRTRYEGGSLCCRAPGFDPKKHVAAVDVRSYQNPCSVVGMDCQNWAATDGNVRGPGHSGKEPIEPLAGNFIIKPNTWVRWFVVFEQRANDWDSFSLWLADENTEPVLVYDRVLVSVRPKYNSIDKFWLEFNSSQVMHVRGDQRDWVAYVRNFVALRDPVDIQGLLLRPATNVPLPPLPPGPAAPKNLKLINFP